LRKFFAVVAVLGLVTVGLIGPVGCGSSSDSGTSGKEGGTLNATFAGFPDYLDPALSYTAEGWTAMGETYLPLLTFAHADGAAGGQIIPALAKEMPKITNGGRTYTLFLRSGLKYSNGEPVKASDFTYAVERAFKVNSGGSPFYTAIVGAEKFAETKTGGIPGIKTNDKTGEIIINLTKPRGTFTNELALMFVAPVPQGTPNSDQSTHPIPATGPYMISKANRSKGWSYVRNPYWAKANAKAMPELPSGHMDKINVQIIRNPSTQVNEVEQGKLEWMQTQIPPDRYPEVKSKYEGTQFRVEKTISTYYFWMNTTKPPFDDVKVRQAVNYAVDPAALERIYVGQLAGTQQILPPGMPGYKKVELYPPNLAKAKEMIEEANPSDRDITVWGDSEAENEAAVTYYQDVLEKIGFNTTLKIVNPDNYFTVIGNLSTPDLDTGWSDWFEDYPHPNDFFQPLLAGESIQPTNNNNFAQIDVPEFNQKIARLGEEPFGPKQEAEYGQLDKEFMEQAPWAPYGNRTVSTFVSSAINLENVIFNLTLGQDLTSFEFK
jgi:peptide/nickel transport system substrate-binding protein